MRFLSLTILYFCFSINYAQINDAFSDGDYTNNPTWNGSITQFTVNSSQKLQLNSSGTDTSFLQTSNSFTLNNTEWSFFVQLAFAPSDNNYAKIYLVSDQTNLKLPLNGYFIRLGENGSFDSVDLYEQSGSTETKIIDGINGRCAKTNNTLRVRVTRDNIGNWTLYSDTLGGINYSLEGTVLDNTHTSTTNFGVWCKYTTSNATKFYFDDFYVGPIIVDNTAPQLDSIKIISSSQVDVYFNEPIDLASAQNTNNYFISATVGNPNNAVRDASNLALVHLTLANPLVSSTSYTLTASSISDLNSNVLTIDTVSFLYYKAKKFDILLNELMVDPDPPVGLPNAEYIELYNRCAYPVNIGNWSLTAGTTAKLLPNYILQPDSFVVVCATANIPLFGISNCIGLNSFVSLTNTGQQLILRDNSGAVISEINYSDSWYRNSTKKNGGWSLEQIDPLNPCGEIFNWTASINLLGGTPGKQNSVYASNQDNTKPETDFAAFSAADTILVFFSESIDSLRAAQTSIYQLNNGIGSPIAALPIAPDFKSVKLTLANSLQPGLIYTISIADSIQDCVGNILSTNNTLRVAVPETTSNGDIVINELLFDPNENCVEFVELYNKSTKVIALNKLQIADYDSITSQLINPKNISTQNRLFFPSDYLVLSTNSSGINSCYFVENKKALIDLPSMPALSNSGDGIAINDLSLTIIDKLSYDEQMHFSLLDDTKGVSLERISFDRPSSDRTNWHSAAANVGYATPTYQNSQYYETTADKEFKLEPEIFSPDNDGYNDILTISYQFNEPDYVLNISIYDANGRLVKRLLKNTLAGATGTYSWDGTDESRNKVMMGIYIVYFEAFNPSNAQKKVGKKSCVVASKLN
ncbi:MAG: lamin tail domain-containing protein [Bacteroidetes bacterium]|nr:lamin tail domain-containing protein [Bacteroidota bacterium]